MTIFNMKTSAETLSKIKDFETGAKMVGGRKAMLPKGEPALTTYIDDVGVPTIGWGHTGHDVLPNMTITRLRAEELFSYDVEDMETEVAKACQSGVGTNQNQFDALVLLCYNIGGNALRNSTLIRRHVAGNYAAAQAQFALWNKGTINGVKTAISGLTLRRAYEANLYATPIAAEIAPATASAPALTVAALYDPNLDKRSTPDAPPSVVKSPSIIAAGTALVTSIPLTISSLSALSDALSQIKANADQYAYLAKLSTALGVVLFALSTFIILRRLSDRNAGVR